jgi:hypothetical protein
MLCKILDFHCGNYEEAFFWDVTSCGSCKNRRIGGSYGLHHQGTRSTSWEQGWKLLATEARCVLRLVVTATVVPSSLILTNLMMKAIPSTETSALTGATRYHITGHGIHKQGLFFPLKLKPETHCGA